METDIRVYDTNTWHICMKLPKNKKLSKVQSDRRKILSTSALTSTCTHKYVHIYITNTQKEIKDEKKRKEEKKEELKEGRGFFTFIKITLIRKDRQLMLMKT